MTRLTKRLYPETKESHKVVDKHPFVTRITKDIEAGHQYIDFNKRCILEVQRSLKLEDTFLQQALHRDIQDVSNGNVTGPFKELLDACKAFPLEHEYMFKVGLLMGGNLLKRYIPLKHHEFLTFENPKDLVRQFTEYLDSHVTDPNTFIQRVNDSYALISLCFDQM